MFQINRSRLAIFASVCALSAAGATSAQAAPVVTGGLVNVTLSDVVDVNNNHVIAQVPIGVAANVCGINANVIVQNPAATSSCETTVDQLPTAFQR